MRKITALLLVFLIGFVSQVPLAIAQPPIDAYAPQLSIIYPPNLPNRFENNSVMLEVNLRLSEGSPRPSNFSYSLDGNQLNDLSKFTATETSYWPPYVFTLYVAKVSLENLSEGNHVVTVYADGMANSRTFNVNSYYHRTVVKILSPTNQTYSSSVPLVFTVNLPIKGAYYYMYRGYEEVFENHFNCNITMDNLKDGNYVLHLYVTTENGDESASTSFSVSNIFAVDVIPYIFGIIVLITVVSLLLYVYQQKRRIPKTNFRTKITF